jgi:serine/threonine protein kinase
MEEALITREQYEQRFQKLLTSSPTPVNKMERQCVKLAGTQFQISERYRIIDVCGQGAYGVVARAVDALTGQVVAIKKISNVFQMDDTYQKRILREVYITKHLRGHENIVQLIDLPPPESIDNFNDVYIVTEYMGVTLSQVIRSEQDFEQNVPQYFIYYILRGLKYMHSAGIVHRDIKPSNILLNEDMDVKICDFGLSRSLYENGASSPDMTTYVVTRWYRAPELLLKYDKVSYPVDIWSVGCILAQMLMSRGNRFPLFKGEDAPSQLESIIAILGTPEVSDICGSDKAQEYIVQTLSGHTKKDWSTIFKDNYEYIDPRALDLLDKMLQFNPHKRISVDEALEHPFFSDIHQNENTTAETCEPIPFWFDKQTMSDHIKRIIYEEIVTSQEELQQEIMEQLESGEEQVVEEEEDEDNDDYSPVL